MQNFKHIEKYEKILDEHEETLKVLKEKIEILDKKFEEFSDLMEYYHSENWIEDLENDSKGNIPEEIKRGVLSEDAIYNLYGDYHEVSTMMLDLASKFFKS